MAVTYTQNDLDAITAAINTGAEEVTIGDRKIKYRSLSQMEALQKKIKDYLEGNQVTEDTPNRITASFSKGRSS
jgi:H2-forming N5,N10-methylenetetrahydromethanopterin dehydrogenase-like enzyme